MKLVSVLRKALSSSTSPACESPGAEALRPPPRWSGAYAARWTAAFKEAGAVHAAIAADLGPGRRSPTTETFAASAAPERPLPLATRVEVTHPAAAKAAGQLHASWLSSGSMSSARSLVMASPRVRDSIPWAAACAEHRVAVVVDVGDRDEAGRLNHCMRSTAPAVLEHHTVAFKAANTSLTGHVLEKRMPELGPDALSRDVTAVMQPHRKGADGRAAAADCSVAVDGEQRGAGALEQRMAWLRIPGARDEAIAPGALLATCRHLRGLKLQGDQTIAFMSPDGDRRSAVFGAAWEIQQQIDVGGWNASLLPELVRSVCMRVGMHRDPTAFKMKEDVASLLAFASLALEERSRA